jgi:hypothetical protein
MTRSLPFTRKPNEQSKNVRIISVEPLESLLQRTLTVKQIDLIHAAPPGTGRTTA